MNHPQILPECYADTLLIEMLGFEPNHKLGIGAVKNSLAKNYKNRLAVGVIDNDKKKPSDFDEFKVVTEKDGIKRCQKEDTKHTLLVISPAFEDWIFENAKAVDVDPIIYGFRSREHFQNICKKRNPSENRQLKQFLNTLKQKKAPGFVQLKTWICEGAGIDERDL